ncbi:MAG: universal stress protein, partial [Chloroflexota bacterium]|nr:universal stress protein [Chloroflexota bacterium]
MYKHILVPLDGSAAAEAALDHVFRLADRFEARITVLMVTGLHLPLTSSYASLDEAASMLELAELDRSDALSYLASLGERLQSRGLNVSVRQAEGAPARVICEIAAKIGADLIAMTTHA